MSNTADLRASEAVTELVPINGQCICGVTPDCKPLATSTLKEKHGGVMPAESGNPRKSQ